MTNPRTILSVGIDIGTTTTQVLFSRLALADVARPGQIPRVAITGREVIYQSLLILTPLLDRDTVDAVRLETLVRNEYAAAGVEPGRSRPAQSSSPARRPRRKMPTKFSLRWPGWRASLSSASPAHMLRA
jgi:hypothetical protein